MKKLKMENQQLPKDGKPTIKNGYRMYYSENHASMKCFPLGYQSVVLSYFVDGKDVLVTYKAHSQEALTTYLKYYPDAKFIFEMKEDSDQKYNGIQCIGEIDIGGNHSIRCSEILPTGTTNSCTRCWNNMRKIMG